MAFAKKAEENKIEVIKPVEDKKIIASEEEKIINPKSLNRKEPKITLEDKDKIYSELKHYVREHIRLMSNHFIKNKYCSKHFCDEVDILIDKTEDELLSFIDSYLKDLIRLNEINRLNNPFKSEYFD